MKHYCPYFCAGEMAERSNAAVLKTVDPKGPGVRIPLSPPPPAVASAKAGFIYGLRTLAPELRIKSWTLPEVFSVGARTQAADTGNFSLTLVVFPLFRQDERFILPDVLCLHFKML